MGNLDGNITRAGGEVPGFSQEQYSWSVLEPDPAEGQAEENSSRCFDELPGERIVEASSKQEEEETLAVGDPGYPAAATGDRY